MIARQYQVRMRCTLCGDTWTVMLEIKALEEDLKKADVVPHIMGDHETCPKRTKYLA